jgi:MFS superfamily sulfate permease-like transporter
VLGSYDRLTSFAWPLRRRLRAVVGSLVPPPRGPLFPDLDQFRSEMQNVLMGSLVIAIVSFTELFSIAKVYGQKLDYVVDPSQELIALGFANTVGGCFQVPCRASCCCPFCFVVLSTC